MTNSGPGRLDLCSNCRRSCYSRLVVVMVDDDGGVTVADATVDGVLAQAVDAGAGAAAKYDRAVVAMLRIDDVRYRLKLIHCVYVVVVLTLNLAALAKCKHRRPEVVDTSNRTLVLNHRDRKRPIPDHKQNMDAP